MKPKTYDDLPNKHIQKDYKKEKSSIVNKIHQAHNKIVHDLDIDDRVFKTVERPAFITMKDHKPNFQNNPTCRLLNPCKPEIGKISKRLLEVINSTIKAKTNLNQWKNTSSVIAWFKALKNKKKLKFIQFDVEAFYPSISKELLIKALTWAKQFLKISDQEIEIITQSKMNLLFKDGTPWTKKGDDPFDVAMGAFDGAETCELIGLFILKDLAKLQGIIVGLYRDDGLAVSSLTARQTENLKKKICEIFRSHGLGITIDANMNCVDFLDVKFNLENDSFAPYMKPNNTPLYVNAKSNHPPNITKNIPLAVNKRLSEISSNERIFMQAAPVYQEALEKSGYSMQLKYQPPQPQVEKHRRKRSILWFNPPFSVNVATNIGHKFLRILDKNFPKGHPLHKILNRNNVKVSYRCTPNLSQTISAHNSKILHPKKENEERNNCNCRNKANCPVGGQCMTKNLIYQTTVDEQNSTETYVGLTGNTFKKRWTAHKSTFRKEERRTATTLSQHIWNLKAEGKEYSLSWKIIGRAKPFNPTSGLCQLCTKEKYHILYEPHLGTLNSRNEVASGCRHRQSQLLRKFDPNIHKT